MFVPHALLSLAPSLPSLPPSFYYGIPPITLSHSPLCVPLILPYLILSSPHPHHPLSHPSPYISSSHYMSFATCPPPPLFTNTSVTQPPFHMFLPLTCAVVEGAHRTGVLFCMLGAIGTVVALRTDVAPILHHTTECRIAEVASRTGIA